MSGTERPSGRVFVPPPSREFPPMLRRHAESNRSTPTDVVGAFEYRFTPSSALSVRLARRVLGAWLQSQPGVDVDGIDDLLVAASELCTNAARHASGAVGSAAIRARLVDDAVVLEVEDDGAGFAHPEEIELESLDPTGEGGRGLFIVQQLVDDVEFERRGRITVVRCCKDGMVRQTTDAAEGGLSAGFQA